MSSNTIIYELPELGYSYDALEPHISTQIMTLHHSKHHATYIANLNKLLTQQQQTNDVRTQLGLQAGIRFNAGGHINHTLFWENLTPASSLATNINKAAPRLSQALESTFGSVELFQSKMQELLLGIQGSGWGWLVSDGQGHLSLQSSKDQDTVTASSIPLIGIDMWEHAYYLQYLNGKAAYVENIWKVINWETAEKRYGELEWWARWQPRSSMARAQRGFL